MGWGGGGLMSGKDIAADAKKLLSHCPKHRLYVRAGAHRNVPMIVV